MAGGVQGPRADSRAPSRACLQGPDCQARRDPAADAETLTVVIWNIAWAYGIGFSDGKGGPKARPLTSKEASTRMGRLFAKAVNPDLILLQEVDFESHPKPRNPPSGTTGSAVWLVIHRECRKLDGKLGAVSVLAAFAITTDDMHVRRGAILSRFPLREPSRSNFCRSPRRTRGGTTCFICSAMFIQVEVDHPRGARSRS